VRHPNLADACLPQASQPRKQLLTSQRVHPPNTLGHDGYSSHEDVLAMPIEIFACRALSIVREPKGLRQWWPPVVLPGEMIESHVVARAGVQAILGIQALVCDAVGSHGIPSGHMGRK